MDSKETAHVPAPDPATFWDFRVGENFILIDGGPAGAKVSLMLVQCERRRAEFMLTFEPAVKFLPTKQVKDWLNMDRPCVALKLANDEPMVTLTLRKIDGPMGKLDGVAYVQVTVHPSLEQRPRPSLDADMRRRGYK